MNDNRPSQPAISAVLNPGANGSITCKGEETFILAASGTYLLHYGRTDGELWVARENIIAWQVRSEFPEPITGNGIYRSNTRTPIILHPDGRVHEVDGFFETYEDWLADVELNFPAT